MSDTHAREHGAIDQRLKTLETARARLWKALYLIASVIALPLLYKALCYYLGG